MERVTGCIYLTSVFDVVVIDVEFGARVCSTSGLESDRDESGVEGVVENVATPCTVVVAATTGVSRVS